MSIRDRARLLLTLVLTALAAAPAAAQHRYTNPFIRRNTLLRLTFEHTLQSERGSTCTFTRPSSATTFDDQGYLVEVGPNVPRYRTIDGDTGIVIEGPRTNYCGNSSYENDLSGWTTTGLVATRVAAARLHGNYGLQLTNNGSAPADATFRATVPASPAGQQTTTLSLYITGANTTDFRTAGTVLIHDGAPTMTAFYPAPRPGWYRATARTSSGGGSESFGIRIPPGTSVLLDAVQLEDTGYDFDYAESTFIPTSGYPATRGPETLTHPAPGFIQPAQGTITIDYYKQSPYPGGEMWWVGRGDGQDGFRAAEWGNYFWQIYINGPSTISGAKVQKSLYAGPGIHRFQGSWDGQQHLAQVWMDNQLADSEPCPDLPRSVSPTMYIGAQGRWGYSLLHFNGVIMNLEIEDFPLRKPTPSELSGTNQYLLLGDVLPEFARDSPQSFTRFAGIIFDRVFTEFWNDIETPRTPASIARPYSVNTLAAAQSALARRGVRRNFIKAASFGNFASRPGWEGGYGLPVNWFNDGEWAFVLANFAKAADFGHRAGLAGFAVDMEYSSDLYWHEFYEDPAQPQHHDGHTRAEREQEAFTRGRQLAQTILRAWPSAELLFIPFEPEFGPLYRQFFVGFVEGARLGNASWVGLMNEYGYQADTRPTAVGTFVTQNSHLEDWLFSLGGQRDLSYWRIYGEHFNAAWPLGSYAAHNKQLAHRSPAMFNQQLTLFLNVNESTTVIYEEMCAWWQMTDVQARLYGLMPGSELYFRNTSPTIGNLADYLMAIPR